MVKLKARIGIPRTPEVCEKIRQAKLGVPRDPETIAKMSAALKGKPGRKQSDEERVQRSQSMLGNDRAKGFRHTDEARARIAKSRIGKPTRGQNYKAAGEK